MNDPTIFAVGVASGVAAMLLLYLASARRKDGLPLLPEKLASAVQSRRVWVAVAAITLELSKGRVILDADQLHAIAAIMGAWIVGDSINKTRIGLGREK